MAEQLNVRQLSYHHAGRLLIDKVSLTLNSGELVSLIGPNGAGKSTLLRLLSGFLPASHGEWQLNDRPLQAWSAAQLARTRAVMRQQNTMTFALSVRELVAMGRAPWPGKPQQVMVEQVMELSGCADLAERNFFQLSGGEQQRVQLARALAQLWHADGPRGWLFLDEPTSALDLYHQQQLLRLLSRLTQQYPLSVCCVLHDLNLASLWSDRILLLAAGKLVAQGTPATVLDESLLTRWYQADLRVQRHHSTGTPQVVLQR